ncbi:MAG: hypothetical protein ACEQSL_09290 [Sediminibacterium sp.]
MKNYTMGHSHDDHGHIPHEAEQNEIGGPVIFAVTLFALVVGVIYFLIQWS